MSKRLIIIFLSVFILAASSSMAMDRSRCAGECVSCHNLTENEASKLLNQTGGKVKSIKQAPAKGMFELLMEKDGRLGTIFIDYGKKHLIQGLILSLDSLQPVMAHAQELLSVKHVSQVNVAALPVEKAIVMGNPAGTRKLYVFTDPDCPYCLKLHHELKKLEKSAADVAIYIMISPLSQHPHAIEKARSLLENKSPDYLDKVFEKKEIPKPISESSKADVQLLLNFADINGITGTPTMVFSDGSILVGARDAESIRKLLAEK